MLAVHLDKTMDYLIIGVFSSIDIIKDKIPDIHSQYNDYEGYYYIVNINLDSIDFSYYYNDGDMVSVLSYSRDGEIIEIDSEITRDIPFNE